MCFAALDVAYQSFTFSFCIHDEDTAFGLTREIQAHIPEDFWHIQVTYTGDDLKRCDFSWDRGRLFDHTAATLLFEICVEEPQATVSKVSTVLPTSI